MDAAATARAATAGSLSRKREGEQGGNVAEAREQGVAFGPDEGDDGRSRGGICGRRHVPRYVRPCFIGMTRRTHYRIDASGLYSQAGCDGELGRV